MTHNRIAGMSAFLVLVGLSLTACATGPSIRAKLESNPEKDLVEKRAAMVQKREQQDLARTQYSLIGVSYVFEEDSVFRMFAGTASPKENDLRRVRDPHGLFVFFDQNKPLELLGVQRPDGAWRVCAGWELTTSSDWNVAYVPPEVCEPDPDFLDNFFPYNARAVVTVENNEWVQVRAENVKVRLKGNLLTSADRDTVVIISGVWDDDDRLLVCEVVNERETRVNAEAACRP